MRSLRSAVILSALAGFALATAPAGAQVVDENLWVTNGTVHALAADANRIYLGGEFTYVGPATGAGVPLDAVTGTPSGPYPRITGEVYAVLPDGSGGLYVGGKFASVGGIPRSNLAHIAADGSVTAWNPSVTGPNSTVLALARDGSTIYVGGFFFNAGGQPRNSIAAVDATTGAATAWNPGCDLLVTTIVKSGPTVYVGGSFSSIGGQNRQHLAALDATTGLATTWDPSPNGAIEAIAVDGATVYAGGNFTTIGGQSRDHLAALSAADGSATSWNPGSDNTVEELAIVGSLLYASGGFSNIGGLSRHGIAALDKSSGVPNGWNPLFETTARAVHGFAVVGGSVYAAGSFQGAAGQERRSLAAVDATTGALLAWNPRCGGEAFALAANGSVVYVGGKFTSVNGVTRNHLAGLDRVTGAADAWNPNVTNSVSAIALVGPRVFVGGEFSQVGGQTRWFVAEIDRTTGAPTAWNPGTDGYVYAMGSSDSTLYVGGWFSHAGGGTVFGAGPERSNVAAFRLLDGQVTSWNPNADAPVRVIHVHNASIVSATSPPPLETDEGGAPGNTINYDFEINVGGEFSSIGGQTRRRFAVLDDTTGAANWLDAQFADDPSTAVYAIALGPDGPMLGGNFDQVAGVPNHNFARLFSYPPSLDWDANESIHAFLPGSPRRFYVGGAFTIAGGQPRQYAAAFDLLAKSPLPWSLDLDGTVVSLADADGIVLGGWFTRIGSSPRSYLARVSYPATTGVPPTPGAAASLSLLGRPNPAQAHTSFAFTLPAAGAVSLTIFDVNGRRVATILDGEARAAGPHVVPFTSASLGAGLYFARLSFGAESVTAKLVVVP